jgi:hypothetical protein
VESDDETGWAKEEAGGGIEVSFGVAVKARDRYTSSF